MNKTIEIIETTYFAVMARQKYYNYFSYWKRDNNFTDNVESAAKFKYLDDAKQIYDKMKPSYPYNHIKIVKVSNTAEIKEFSIKEE